MKKLFFILSVFILSFGNLNAQPAHSVIQGSGELLSEIAITPGGDLNFGIMTREQDNTVDVANDDAGYFIISIDVVGEVLFSFNLPTHLTNGAGGQVPLTFSDTDAGYGFANQTGQQSTRFNPNTPTGIYLHNSQQDWHVYIGGTATPGVDAPMGTYSADITLTAEYN
jgi:hypothetical protein